MLRAYLHSQTWAHTHTLPHLARPPPLQNTLSHKCNNHNQTTELSLSAVPNLSTHPANRKSMIASMLRNYFSAKEKNIRVSISSVVCSCLHLSRKEELIWATIDERQHRKLFLLPLHYLLSQKKQTAVTLSQVLYAMWQTERSNCKKKKKELLQKQATQRKTW